MISKPHRNNSDFQLRHFLAGSCHTADGAWMLLYGQKIDVEVKIKHGVAQNLRRIAAIMDAQATIDSVDSSPSEKMIAEADIIEQTSGDDAWELNQTAAKNELATINALMTELEPLRKFAHLPVLEANEAAQQGEWLGELKERAENFLITQGTIPHDQLHTMRCHPDFKSDIVPFIELINDKMKNGIGLGLLSPHALLLESK